MQTGIQFFDGILTNTGTAQWFMNIGFQSFFVVTTAWLILRAARRRSAPTQSARTSWWNKSIVRTANLFFIVWILGALVLLLRFFRGLNYVRGFKQSLLEASDDHLLEISSEAAAVFGFKTLPRVFLSPAIESPLALGLFKPVIVIPFQLYDQLSHEELKSLLLHEMAHIHHKDQLPAYYNGWRW